MNKQVKPKTGIRRKLAMIVCGSAGIIWIVCISFGYFWGYNLLKDTIGKNYVEMAGLLNEAMQRILIEEISDMQLYISLISRTNELEARNLIYKDMDKDSIRQYLSEMDKKWIEPADDSPFIKGYLELDVSQRLRELVRLDDGLSEVFITDKFGGLVALSGRTSDFYQADEEWWQEAFDDGKGAVYFGDVSFDESSKTLSLPLAAPIKDRSGKVVGVAKTILDIKRLFAPLKGFRIGKTGHAVLVNSDGYVLFHDKIVPLKSRFVKKEDFKELLKSDKQWMVTDSAWHHKKVFIAFTSLDYHEFAKKGMGWSVCIEQDAKEVFAPLHELFIQLLLLTCITLPILVIIGFLAGGIFSRPIKKFREATDRIAAGNLDCRAEVKTGDELEGLADSFNMMVDRLKKNTTSIDNLNREVANRKKAEEEIERLQRRIEFVLGATRTGIDIIDSDYNLLYVDTEWQKIYGDYKGRKCYEYFGGRKDICPTCAVPQALKTKKLIVSEEILPKEQNRPIQVTTVPFQNEKGEWLVAEINADITERKKAEKAVMEAAEIKSKFASMASHELRNPVFSIKQGISMILEGLAGNINEKQKKFLEIVNDNADTLMNLANDLLDFQKLEAGKMLFKMQEGDINKAVRESYDTIHLLAEQKGLYCVLELDNKLPSVSFDRDKIKQVMANLITNAIKFTGKGGIKIYTYKEGNIVHVKVQDTGPGIKKEDLPKLFQTFSQVATPTKSREKGTGLGLAICKEIIEGHRGKIWVESEPDKGATFHFILPVEERRA